MFIDFIDLNDLGQDAMETARKVGFHNPHQNKSEQIALMHSELSEALEALRKPDQKDKHLPHLDPVGVELADTIIRIVHFAAQHNIDLSLCVSEKMAFNETRTHRHGGKEF